MTRGRTYQQIVAERGPMGFAPPWRDQPEEPECPCVDGEWCPAHGQVCHSCGGGGVINDRYDPPITAPCVRCNGTGYTEKPEERPEP